MAGSRSTAPIRDGARTGCDNGEKVRIAFTLDCCDREAISWVATTGGIDSSDIRDLMIESVEPRFGLVDKLPKPIEEVYAEVGDGLTGRRRRIVGVFEPPLLQQRSDTPCPMLTLSSCFSQGRSPTRSPRFCATERAPYWPKRLRPRWRNSSPSMSI